MVKKFSFGAALFAMVMLASCSGNKEKNADSDTLMSETSVNIEETMTVNNGDTTVSGQVQVTESGAISDSTAQK